MTPEEEIEALELEQELRRRRGGGAKPAAAPAPEEPGFFSKVGTAINDAGKAVTEGSEDALTTFNKYGSLGLDDNIAGAAAAAGSLFGAARDEATGFGTVGDVRGDMATAYREGRDERRKETEAAAERSPVMSTLQGALPGVGLQILAAPASFAGQVATGAVGAVGASDADTPEDAVVPALVGGALGTAGKSVPALGRLLGRIKGGASSLLRQAQPAATAAAEKVAGGLESLATSADSASPVVRGGLALATGGSSEVGLAGAKGVSSLLRRATAKAPTGSLVPEMGADDLGPLLAKLKAGGEEAAAPVTAAADDVVSPAVAAVDDVPAPLLRPATPSAAAAPEPESLIRPKALEPEVITTPGPVAKPSAMPELRGLDAQILETATRLGTTDLATISQALKLPSTRVEGSLRNLLRQFRFRDAVAKSSPTPSQKLAEAAPDMPADMGSVIRKAKETARSPIDNVSGRNIKQVAAVKQQETWRATYDGLNPAQRSQFLQQIKQESGLPDDVIRQRLKLTKAEWRRLSFDRGGALSARPDSVLRRKKAPVEEPNASGGEGESEALTDMEQALLDRNAADAAEVAAPKSSFTTAREAEETALKGADAAKVADKALQKQIMEGNTPDWIKEALAKEKLTDTNILPPRVQAYVGESRLAMADKINRALQGADERAFADTMDLQGTEDLYAIIKEAEADPAFDAQYWLRRTLKDNGFKDSKMLKDAASREAHEGAVAYERKWRKDRGLPPLEDFEGPVEVIGGARPAAKTQDKTADELSAMMDKMLKKAKAKQAKQAKTTPQPAPAAPTPKPERLIRPVQYDEARYQAAADRANVKAPNANGDPRQMMNNAFMETGETAKILEYFEMPPLTGARAKAAEALGGAADDPLVIVRTPFHPAGSFSVGSLGKDGVVRAPMQRHTLKDAQAFVAKMSAL